MLNGLGFLLAFAIGGSGGAPAAAPCPSEPQPMPAAIESVGEPSSASSVVAFAATPWESPGRAWVFRASQVGALSKLEIFRLARRYTCNVWDIDGKWQSTMRAEDHRSLNEAVRLWITPPAGFPAVGGTTDGTMLELRVRTSGGWEVTRTLNHYGAGGANLSAIFQDLMGRHVPENELPTPAWRSRQAH